MTDTIILLSDRDKVRERPGMYIGDTSALGLETIVREVIDNAYDEYTNYKNPDDPIIVTLHEDDSVSVEDYGRGISPYESKANPGQIEERLAFTRIGAGGKMRANRKANGSQFSAGLNGTGAAATNFTSEFFDVTIYKEDGIYHDRYENGGIPVEKLIKGGLPVSPPQKGHTGTLIHFKPDSTFFRVTKISVPTLKRYFNQMQYLHPGSTLIFNNERDDETIVYHSDNGLVDYLRIIATEDDKNDLAGKPVSITTEGEDVVMGNSVHMRLNLAMGLSKKGNGRVLAFTNTTYNKLGGTHETGFYNGCLALLRHYYKTFKSEIDNENKARIALINKVNSNTPIDKLIKRKHVEDRFYAVIDLKHDDPELQPQTKDKLVSDEVTKFVADAVFSNGVNGFDRQIAIIQSVISDVIKELWEKAKETDENVKIDEKDAKLYTSSKLASAKGKNPEENELFLVEGDSAGGSIKSNRDPSFQAILPLRGKVLNVEKSTLEKALANAEISTFFAALGCGFGANFDIKKLKYHRIIIATDQDVDGLHIRTLIITLIAKYAPELILNGNVYILETPLFVNEMKNGKEYYMYDDASQQAFVDKHRASIKKVNRNKGLGELEQSQVITTILTPETRKLSQCYVENIDELNRIIKQLMGNDVAARRSYFIQD